MTNTKRAERWTAEGLVAVINEGLQFGELDGDAERLGDAFAQLERDGTIALRFADGTAFRVTVRLDSTIGDPVDYSPAGRAWSSNPALIDPNLPSQRRFDR